MRTKIDYNSAANPIVIQMNYGEAISLLHAIMNNIDFTGNFPITKEFYDKLTETVQDAYFD